MQWRAHSVWLLGGLSFVALAGCSAVPGKPSWGAQWPDFDRVKQAAVGAFKDPQTWAPLAGAAVLSIDDWDEKLSAWAIRETPLFGGHAENASDLLLTAAEVSYVLTAIAAPSDTLGDKVSGLAAGSIGVLTGGAVVDLLKQGTGRDRPNGGSGSLPSGHAYMTASTTDLALLNASYIDLPAWARTTFSIGMHATAIGTAWARVEAAKHYPTDVLVGYALGNFFAEFVHRAFIEDARDNVMLKIAPMQDGAQLTLTVVY